MPSGVKIEDDPKIQLSRSEEANLKKTTATIVKSASEEVPSIRKASSKDRREAGPNPKEVNEESVEVVLGEEGQGKVVGESLIDKSKQTPDQNVFRHPQALKPKAMRAPSGPPIMPPPHHSIPPPHMYPHHHQQPPHGQPYPHPAYYPYPHSSGSWGYGPPPPPPSLPHGEYHPRAHMPRPPYPVPPYSGSGSFEDQGAYHHHTPHYSPHVQYPPPSSRYPNEEVNVISPNHKMNSPPGHRPDNHYRPPPPTTPSRSRHLTPPQHYYQYPPTSPVSRPDTQSSGAPRLRNYAMRRGEGAYNRSQQSDRSHRPEDSPWSGYGHPPSTTSRDSKNRHQAPIVADSFDSGHISRTSHPATPGGHHPAPPPTQSSSDPHYEFYGGGGSWGSFDSANGPPPPHMDDHRYYNSYPPESPYSPYAAQYSPGPVYRAESFPSPGGYGPALPPAFTYSFDEEHTRLLQDYNPDHDGESFHKQVTPPGNSKKSGRSKNSTPVASNISDRNSVLPKAAEEIDFDVACPPMEPILPESNDEPSCESLAEVNTYDVLCGRGGGTNSQVGNRRFRQLVQEFQPIYLLAKRKEKPLLARTIVLIIRKRGGRFLRKNEETGQLFEVGDTKAEAKTSQALREGLDVRATKSARNLHDKQKKKKKGTPKSPGSDTTMESPMSASKSHSSTKMTDVNPRTESPPTLPRLHGEIKVGEVHPHSPDKAQFRKRRRMRSQDRFFVDFCPPRDEIGQAGCNPLECGGRFEDDDDGVLQESSSTPIRRNNSLREREAQYEPRGCAGIALDIVTGAATASFCLGPSGWRR